MWISVRVKQNFEISVKGSLPPKKENSKNDIDLGVSSSTDAAVQDIGLT